jgi:hypothetical protein
MADPSATPLTNADFRKLLATPRRVEEATPKSTPRRGACGVATHKPKKPYVPKTQANTEEGEDEPKYRCDRVRMILSCQRRNLAYACLAWGLGLARDHVPATRCWLVGDRHAVCKLRTLCN